MVREQRTWRATSLPTSYCPPSFPEQARGAHHSHGLAGAQTQTPKEPRPTRPPGGFGAGPRLPQHPGPPRLLSEHSPRAALPRVQPRTTPSRGAHNPCTAKESSTAANRLLLPTQEAFPGSRGIVSGTQSSTRGGVTSELPFPQRRGCHGCRSGKQCLHSKPNSFQKNLFCCLSHFLF